jgi:hypothetical protein
MGLWGIYGNAAIASPIGRRRLRSLSGSRKEEATLERRGDSDGLPESAATPTRGFHLSD